MRYSVVAACTGLEVLARAGYASIAPRVFGKLTEMIGAGGDLGALLDGLTEEKMHADDNMTKAEEKLAARMSNPRHRPRVQRHRDAVRRPHRVVVRDV